MNKKICYRSGDDCWENVVDCDEWKCNFDIGWHSSYFESNNINSDNIYSKVRLERDLYKVLEYWRIYDDL